MIWAFSRLFLIAIFSVFTMFMGVFGLRRLATREEFVAYKHPLVSEKPLLVASGGDHDFGPEQSASALRAADKLKLPLSYLNPIFIGLKIRLTADGQWVLYAPEKLETLTGISGFVSQKTRAEIEGTRYKKDQSPILFLTDVLKVCPEANFYIDVLQPAHPALSDLFEWIQKSQLENRIVLRSEFTDTSREIRQKSARWLTGASVAESSKTFFLLSLYLEPTMQLNSDVFVTSKYKFRLFEELFRRKKVVLYETNDFAKFSEIASVYPAVGIVTTRPTYFLQSVARNAKTY